MIGPKLPTQIEAKRYLRSIGISFHVGIDREYRIDYIDATKDTAYYTNDLIDAVQTGARMIQARKDNQ